MPPCNCCFRKLEGAPRGHREFTLQAFLLGIFVDSDQRVFDVLERGNDGLAVILKKFAVGGALEIEKGLQLIKVGKRLCHADRSIIE